MKMKGEGELKRKARHRQTKHTIGDVIRPTHEDCQEAFRKLSKHFFIENENDSINHEFEDNDENSELSDAISIIDDFFYLHILSNIH